MEYQKYLEHAIQLAGRNVTEKGGRPFGAVVVRNGEIIAVGTNDVLETNDPTSHAEMTAIREACRVLGTEFLSDCEIYASGEPCPMCQGAIRLADLKAVYYASPRERALSSNIAKAGKNKEIPIHYVEMKSGSEPFELWVNRNKPIS